MTPFKRLTFFSLAVCLVSPVSATESRTPWFGGAAKAEVFQMPLPRTIKVALLRTRKPITIRCTGSYAYEPLKKGKRVEVGSNTSLKVIGIKGGMTIGSKKFTGTVHISPIGPKSFLSVNKRSYRGELMLKPRGNGVVDVIEQVPLEEYLYGVLPREVGADWPVESLKAQAVISRTFVVANIRQATSKGYDVTNDVFSQVYGGLNDEHAETNQAVRETRGEILIDEKNSPLMTFFHSSCGGRTENPSYVWREVQKPSESLDSVKDPFCRGDPFYEWDLDISADALSRRLRRKGYNVGTIKEVKIAKTSPSGRAWVFSVDSSRGKIQIPGNAFRLAVGPEALRSTLVTTLKKRGNQIRFEGHGWGHGVGMCQWGARGRALEGHAYPKILDAYYPKSRLVQTSSDSTREQPKK